MFILVQVPVGSGKSEIQFALILQNISLKIQVVLVVKTVLLKMDVVDYILRGNIDYTGDSNYYEGKQILEILTSEEFAQKNADYFKKKKVFIDEVHLYISQ